MELEIATQAKPFTGYAVGRTLPRPYGSRPVPAAFEEGLSKFEAGVCAFDADRFDEAARLFMQAAMALRIPEDHFYSTSFVTARSFAYDNALAAFVAGARFAEARAVLGEAANRDAACKARIESGLRAVPSV